jgi:hypothetical protein
MVMSERVLDDCEWEEEELTDACMVAMDRELTDALRLITNCD